MRNPRCNIWADPGLGKTASVLYALDALRMAGSSKFPALVIAPTRVAKRVWSDEIRKWADFHNFRYSRIVGTPDARAAALDAKADIYVINYENLQWLIEQYRKRPWPFRIVIADESQRLKGFRLKKGTKRAAALAKIAHYTARWVNLSGTPTPGGIEDAWGQMWFVDFGKRLGRTFGDFAARFLKHNPYTHAYTANKGAAEQVTDLIADVTLNIEVSECFDLPPMTVNPIYVDLPYKALQKYKSMESEFFARFKVGDVDAANAADKSNKCMQIATGAIYTDKKRASWELVHNAKMEALDSLVSEMNGAPLMVVYHYRHDLARLLDHFPKARRLKSDKDQNAWNAGKVQMGIIHSATPGLNLQHAWKDWDLEHGSHICIFSQFWNLENFLQVIERAGQTRLAQAGYNTKMLLHLLIAKDTFEEDAVARRESKKSVMQTIRSRVRRAERYARK
jgi:hypothetical protein